MSRAVALSALLAALALPCAAAPPRSASPGAQDPAPPADGRLTEWPALADEAAAKKELARLRKATTEEMAVDAAAKVRALGAGMVPLLLDALGKDRAPEAQERLLGALTALTGAPHTRLLAREWSHESPAVRAFALDRVATFPDAGLVAEARALFVSLSERAQDPKARLKPDEEELDRAARVALSTGALEGVPRCLAQAERDWRKYGAALRTACAGAKSDAANELLLPKLTGASTDAARVAALRLLAAAGTQPAVSTIRRFLDAEANAVRVAAINALRGIVDGAPPLEELSVFTAIEEAKRWKERT